MISKLKKYIFKIVDNYLCQFRGEMLGLTTSVITYGKEAQSLSGRIKILEEQQEIMHNFLVEINKYLVKLTEKKDELRISEAKTEDKKAGERGCYFGWDY